MKNFNVLLKNIGLATLLVCLFVSVKVSASEDDNYDRNELPVTFEIKENTDNQKKPVIEGKRFLPKTNEQVDRYLFFEGFIFLSLASMLWLRKKKVPSE